MPDIPDEQRKQADEQFMRMAIAQARIAGANGEVPVGAVLVRDGVLLAQAANSVIAGSDPTAHAEIIALRQAGLATRNYRLEGTTLYVTLEPCIMCAGALVHARVERLVFGARDLRFGGVRAKFRLADSDILNHQVQISEGVLGVECLELLKSFFESRR
ncbi:MAG: tRNA adenosine(34) deaminase TadA [Bryobacterales bacterium]|nr:tRNA adenosine(34) deaminase TadA [Bryobacterales bacterium]